MTGAAFGPRLTKTIPYHGVFGPITNGKDLCLMPHDPVNCPDHYTFGGIETIDYLKAKLSAEEFAGFC